MPKRVRLTQRRGRQAVDGSIPYPGNVNQPDRQFKKHDQYDNWEEVINHPLPDMRHDWKNDERDEIGFGIPEPWGESPTVASVRVAANKSVKLAYFLLGDKVAESIIEDQAGDFMLLGPEALDRTLARFAQTGELYASDDEDEDDEDEDEGEAKEASTKEVKAEDGKEEEEKAAEPAEEEKEEGAKKEASEALAEEGAEEDEPVEDTGASEVEASDKSDEGEPKEAAKKKADDDGDEDDDDESDEGDSKEASAQTVNEMDIELTSTMDDGAVEQDSRLAGLFDDDIPAELPEPGAGKREASEKKGIKSLGGQPRVAGNGGESQDISSIWADAPDVSEVFR